MTVLNNFLDGPFACETTFKAAALKRLRKGSPKITFFEIENSKEDGMPDIISMSNEYAATFIETKVSDSNGYITFQSTQPLFYKKHKNLIIHILAWDARGNRTVFVEPQEVIQNKKLKLKIPRCLDEYKAIS
jgi:hypothetical protein